MPSKHPRIAAGFFAFALLVSPFSAFADQVSTPSVQTQDVSPAQTETNVQLQSPTLTGTQTDAATTLVSNSAAPAALSEATPANNPTNTPTVPAELGQPSSAQPSSGGFSPLLTPSSPSSFNSGFQRPLNPLQSQATRADIDQTTGALTYSYPIPVPPGRNGIEPQLTLEYNSQINNRADTILGAGWSLSIPWIILSPKGGTSSTYSVAPYVSSLSGELVHKADGTYGARVEKGDFMTYTYSSSTWTMRTKAGLKYTFGDVDSARQKSGTRISKWMLTEIRDLNGNSVNYTYQNDGQQIYPTSITYTNYNPPSGSQVAGIFKVNFTLASRPDPLTSYRTGFLVTTNDRISKIDVLTNNVVRDSFALSYGTADNANTYLLSSVTETGTDVNNHSLTLPPTSFTYRTHTKSWTKNTDSSKWQNPVQNVSSTYGNISGVQYVDVNGDGLPDVVTSVFNYPAWNGTNPCDYGFASTTTPRYIYNTFLNTGTGWSSTPSSTWSLPMPLLGCSNQDLGTRIVDVNGDGLPDVVFAGPEQYASDTRSGGLNAQWRYVFINNGHGWTWDQTWTFPGAYFVVPPTSSNPNGDGGTRMIDINGDGLTDVVQSVAGANPNIGVPYVYINNGHGWDLTAGWSVPVPFAPSKTTDGQYIQSHTIQLLDINGDGLLDFIEESVYQKTGYIAVGSPRAYINNGTGFVYAPSITVPTGVTKGAYYSLSGPWITNDTEFVDINGDGLTDIVDSAYNRTSWSPTTTSTQPGWWNDYPNFPSDTSSSLVYLNNGKNGWTQVSWTIPRAFVVPGYSFTGSVLTPAVSFLDRGVQFVDLDGDGSLDLAFTSLGGNQDNSGPMYLGNRGTADTLNQVQSAKGATTAITYRGTAELRKNDGSLFNPVLPMDMQVVQAESVNDGNGIVATTTYQYQDGMLYTSSTMPFDHEMAGFGKVTQTGTSSSQATYYDQGNTSNPNSGIGAYQDAFEKIGMPYRIETSDILGNLYDVKINQYTSTDAGDSRKFVHLSQSVDKTYDGGSSHRDTAQSFTYDAHGNPTQVEEWGEVTANDDGTFTDTGSDARITTHAYATPTATSTNAYGFSWDDILKDASNNKLKETTSTYDGLALGSVSSANLTKTGTWNGGSLYFPHTMSYTAQGLLATSTDALGHATQNWYDSTNLYPATTTNALSQATTYAYDPAWGVVATTTDSNGNITASTYDPVGRLLAQYGPDPTTGSRVQLIGYAYNDTIGSLSATKTTYIDASNTATDVAYMDGLGRTIQTRHSAPNGQFQTVDTVYDQDGHISWNSLPYYSSGSSKTSPTATAALKVSYSYDALNRQRTQTNAVGTSKTDYSLWNVTKTDPLNRTEVLAQDAYGNTVSATEHLGTNAYTTNYGYDLAGNLTNLTDAAGNIRAFQYDALGERTRADDLHAATDTNFGYVTSTYDADGNVSGIGYADNTSISNTYDALNRLTQSMSGAAVLKSLTYDTCTLGKGKLCAESNPAYTKNYSYDPASYTASTTLVNAADGKPYNEQYQYDRAGKVTGYTAPDGMAVTWNYSGDQVSSVTTQESGHSANTVVSGVTYDPTGQISQVTYGNGAQTVNTTDANHLYRLTSKETSVPSSGLVVQNLQFSYDPVGNITEVTESASTTAARDVTYAYDDLDRLASATATISGIPLYQDQYTYDTLGNILTATQQVGTSTPQIASYSYQGNTGSSFANPDAVTSIVTTDASSTPISTQNVSYDERGNMAGVGMLDGSGNPVTSSSRVYVFDSLNQLAQVGIGSGSSTATTTFAYDVNGERVIQGFATSTDLCVSPNYNIAEDASGTIIDTEKHIFDGNLLLGSVEGSGSGATLYMDHTDQLSGASAVTNPSGTLQENVDYYPFGAIRVDTQVGSFSEERKYIDQLYDSSTGLSYLNARYYDENSGQFLNEDPIFWKDPKLQNIADPQSLNSYSYSEDNPISKEDPKGLFNMSTGQIQKGDTLSSITSQINSAYGTKYTVGSLASVNGITNSNVIYAGNYLKYSGLNAAPAAQATNESNKINSNMAALTGTAAVFGGMTSNQGFSFPNLQSHFENHGDDFGASSPEEYAQMSQDFITESLKNNSSALFKYNNEENTLRVYNPSSNVFGSYNTETGGTRTFYQPDPEIHGYSTNDDYWNAQTGQGITPNAAADLWQDIEQGIEDTGL